jgi:hypothetical protein
LDTPLTNSFPCETIPVLAKGPTQVSRFRGLGVDVMAVINFFIPFVVVFGPVIIAYLIHDWIYYREKK